QKQPQHLLVAITFSASVLLNGVSLADDTSPPDSPTPFSRADVVTEARALAAAPYQAPPQSPPALASLDYDTYRQIRYRHDEAIWGDSPTRFAVELFAPGFLYRDMIDINVVENGVVRPVGVDQNAFDAPTPAIKQALERTGKFAGFRLHYPLHREDYRDEFLVFQGASYFRGVSADQGYGLSARGLAIDVGEATGEEFPFFREFWIERPAAHANAIVVHAILDSPRIAGAYTMRIYPGVVLTMDITATLLPRATLEHVGIAPLTSMYLHGAIDPPPRPDYRPRVHDSDGLAVRTGTDEFLWRPLSNPQSLQFSAFMDADPKGYGLLQRTRHFDGFQDLEARYHERPSAWVVPNGDWGKGAVQLVEIPTPEEVHDNIVAYFRPSQALEAGSEVEYRYRLTWPGTARSLLPRRMARVVRSALGVKLGEQDRGELVVDYAFAAPVDEQLLGDMTLDVQAPAALEARARLQSNPHTQGFRVVLDYRTPVRKLSELRLRPMWQGEAVGETWLYRLSP
ncbi:MAG: glucan biosynthesis protein G, partial [Pseudomonadota bacterium]